jgi:hypothetical protein
MSIDITTRPAGDRPATDEPAVDLDPPLPPALQVEVTSACNGDALLLQRLGDDAGQRLGV